METLPFVCKQEYSSLRNCSSTKFICIRYTLHTEFVAMSLDILTGPIATESMKSCNLHTCTKQWVYNWFLTGRIETYNMHNGKQLYKRLVSYRPYPSLRCVLYGGCELIYPFPFRQILECMENAYSMDEWLYTSIKGWVDLNHIILNSVVNLTWSIYYHYCLDTGRV